MNNWIDSLLGLFSPHICKDCSRLGKTLCSRCTFDILQQKEHFCALCYSPTKTTFLCHKCKTKRSTPFLDIYSLGVRRSVLKRLVGDYKFNSEYQSAQIIADLIHNHLNSISSDTVITFIPTINNHIRQRGFDHMALVAKIFAKKRGLKVANLLVRTDNVVQHKLNLKSRKKAPEKSIAINKKVKHFPEKVLLIDDIWTTGSTMLTAGRLLKEHKVKQLFALAVIVQPSKDFKK